MGLLKSLEKVLATVIGDKQSHVALGPLHGIDNLRLAEIRNVVGEDLNNVYELTKLDRTSPFVIQGRDLLIACVTSLHKIADFVS